MSETKIKATTVAGDGFYLYATETPAFIQAMLDGDDATLQSLLASPSLPNRTVETGVQQLQGNEAGVVTAPTASGLPDERLLATTEYSGNVRVGTTPLSELLRLVSDLDTDGATALTKAIKALADYDSCKQDYAEIDKQMGQLVQACSSSVVDVVVPEAVVDSVVQNYSDYDVFLGLLQCSAVGSKLSTKSRRDIIHWLQHEITQMDDSDSDEEHQLAVTCALAAGRGQLLTTDFLAYVAGNLTVDAVSLIDCMSASLLTIQQNIADAPELQPWLKAYLDEDIDFQNYVDASEILWQLDEDVAPAVAVMQDFNIVKTATAIEAKAAASTDESLLVAGRRLVAQGTVVTSTSAASYQTGAALSNSHLMLLATNVVEASTEVEDRVNVTADAVRLLGTVDANNDIGDTAEASLTFTHQRLTTDRVVVESWREQAAEINDGIQAMLDELGLWMTDGLDVDMPGNWWESIMLMSDVMSTIEDAEKRIADVVCLIASIYCGLERWANVSNVVDAILERVTTSPSDSYSKVSEMTTSILESVSVSIMGSACRVDASEIYSLIQAEPSNDDGIRRTQCMVQARETVAATACSDDIINAVRSEVEARVAAEKAALESLFTNSSLCSFAFGAGFSLPKMPSARLNLDFAALGGLPTCRT